MKRHFILFFLINLITINAVLSLSPSRNYLATPHDLKMSFKELIIQTSDSYDLNAWYFNEANSKNLVIISHDGTGNMGDYLDRVQVLVRYGFSVLMYDYRGFGESQDFKIDPLNYIYKEFYIDLEGVINYSKTNFDQEIVLYGWGIGGGISICKAYQMDNIKGLIADDPFADVFKLKSTFKKAGVVMNVPTNILNDKYSPYQSMKNASELDLRGIQLFHGNKNYLFNKSDINQLYQIANLENRELYIFKNAEKMDNFTVNQSEYARKMYIFVMNL